MSRVELAATFFRIGSLAWGGGGATLAMMHQELCVRRRLVDAEEFHLLFGLSRLVPGMNLLALTVLLGHRARGLEGVFTALVAMTLPSFSLILLGCWLVAGDEPGRGVTGAVRGLSAAVVALLAHTGWQLCRASLEKPPGRVTWAALALLALALVALTPVHPAWIVAGGGAAGAALALGQPERRP